MPGSWKSWPPWRGATASWWHQDAGSRDEIRGLIRAVAATRATTLATEDDTSVAQEFFTVTVRPWQVMLQARP